MFKPRGSIKGQHLADFVSELSSEGPIEPRWKLYVDGSSGRQGGGARIVLEGPNGIKIEQSLIFQFKVSNNQAEYEALVAGMELAKDLGAELLECKTDSQLLAGQMNENFQVKDDQLLLYFRKAKHLADGFKFFEIRHIPREENARADKLSKLTAGKEKGHLASMIRQVMVRPTIECFQINGLADREDWRREIASLIKKQEEGQSLRPEEAKQIARYVLIGEELYRRGYVTPMLKCLSKDEVEYVM